MVMRQSRSVRNISIILLGFIMWSLGGVRDIAFAVKASAQNNLTRRAADAAAPESRLETALKDIERIVKQPGFDRAKAKKLKEKRAEIEALDKSMRGEFAETEKHLKKAGVAGEILRRHSAYVSRYEKNVAELMTSIKKAETAAAGAQFDSEAGRIREYIEKAKPPRGHKPFDPNKLPHRAAEPVKKEPRTRPEEFRTQDLAQGEEHTRRPILLASNGPLTRLLDEGFGSFNSGFLLAQAAVLPTAEDLAQSIEVQFTPEIASKAAELDHDPVKIYNWVRNNIEFVPTYGSIQGAQMCMDTKECNAFDTASLLLALLRVSNIPARYVTGTIEIPIEKLKNWVGGFSDAQAALNSVSSGGIPVTGVVYNGELKSARMEHTWVEAYIDYIPSRGANNKAGDTWIPLDAAFKQYNYTEGIDIKTLVPFNSESIYNHMRSTATINEAQGSVTNVDSTYLKQQLDDYRSQVDQYLAQHYPNATAQDVIGKREVLPEEFPFLMGTLPYPLVVKGSTFSTVPNHLRHSITFQVGRSNEGADFSFTASLPELAGQRITLSYPPATEADKALIQSYGDASSLPAYLISLKPQLKIEGITKATGNSISMGDEGSFTMTFTSPDGRVESVHNSLIAGEYYAVILDGSSIPAKLVGQRKSKMQVTRSLFTAGQYDGIGLDDVIGESLNALGLMYFYELERTSSVNGRLAGVSSNRLPSEGIVFYGLVIDYLFGVPRNARAGSLNIDVDRDVQTVVSLHGDSSTEKNFTTLTGMLGSGLEHGIFEQVYKREGVSAIKALSVANTGGIPIYEITQDNLQTVFNSLEVSEDVKQDIIDNVSIGNSVTISRTNIAYQGWTGVGYIVKDPRTGGAGYLISGGLAGGGLPDSPLDLLSCLFLAPAEAGDGTKEEQGLSIDPIVGLALLVAFGLVAIAESIEIIEALSAAWQFLLFTSIFGVNLLIILAVLIAIIFTFIAIWMLWEYVIKPNASRRRNTHRYAFAY